MATAEDPIIAENRRKFEENQRTYMQSWQKVVDSGMTHFPEEIFRQEFLPLFCGEDHVGVLEKLELWRTIAQGWSRGVWLVDSRRNPVLFVPPLVAFQILEPISERNAVPMSFHVQVAGTLSERGPGAGDAYLQRNMVEQIKHMARNIGKKRPQVERQWQDVFEFYGKLPSLDKPVEAKVADQVTQTVVKPPPEPEDEYDY